MRPKFCEKCGNELLAENIFCEHCGWKVTGYDEVVGHDGATDHDGVTDHDEVIGYDEVTGHGEATGHDKTEGHNLGESPAGEPASITQETVNTTQEPASAIDLPPEAEKKDLPLLRLFGILLLFIGAMVLWKTVFKGVELMDPPLVSDKGVFFADFGRDSRLYRIDLDGKNKKRLSKEYIKVMDAEDGWIYYSSIFGIYKIREDGTEETRILDKTANYIQVSEGWIYFVDYDYHICRVKTDGTEFEQLGDYSAVALRHDAGWLYYRNPDSGHCISRVRTDGSERQQVTADRISFYNYDVSDGVVYYMNDDDSGYLYRINGDGTEKQKLNECYSRDIVVKDDWIYYAQGWQGNPAKIRIDGSEGTTIGNDHAKHFAIFGDWLYYADSRKDIGLYKLKIDGSERKKLK